jgi:hypothetical protein
MTGTETPAPAAAVAENPPWIKRVGQSYQQGGKSLIVLTGNVRDLHWSKGAKRFVSLEQAIYQAVKDGLLPVRFDSAHGITFFDEKDEAQFVKAVQASTTAQTAGGKPTDIKGQINATRGDPLAALVLLKECGEAVANARLTEKGKRDFKPLCIIIDYGAALFPAGDLGTLSEIDRQRLVHFLSWVGSPFMAASENLICLVADTKVEVSSRLFSLPSTETIEIELPSSDDRDRFVRGWIADKGATIDVEGGLDTVIHDTAGIKLVKVEDLLKEAHFGKTTLTRAAILDRVNEALVAELGDIVKIRRPTHTAADIIGRKTTVKQFLQTFNRCKDPKTAVSAIVVPGSNGVGKTFLVEGVANTDGWVVLALSGVRDKWFGETDRKFEKLALVLQRFRRVIIYVEEARATLGSVHRGDVHETERRLTGYIISMMSNKAYLGRVLWVLDTARPDGLDPDIQRRAPIGIGVFDPEGEERVAYIKELLSRNKLSATDVELAEIVKRTERYSASDLNTMVTLARGDGTSVLQVLEYWEAPDISVERHFQSLVAMLHCTYKDLIPPSLRGLDRGEVQKTVEEFKALRGI